MSADLVKPGAASDATDSPPALEFAGPEPSVPSDEVLLAMCYCTLSTNIPQTASVLLNRIARRLNLDK